MPAESFMNVMSVDVEDYFHAEALASAALSVGSVRLPGGS